MEFLKDLVEAWSNRIRSPIAGYFGISFLASNWKSIWYLLFADSTAEEKFRFFDSNTNLNTLLIIPAIIAIAISVCLPWLNLLGAIVTRAPNRRFKNMQYDQVQEHRIYRLNKSAEEAEATARYEAAIEEAKISAARRLQEAQEVGGQELEEELQSERTQQRSQNLEQLAVVLEDEQAELINQIGQTPEGTFEISSDRGQYYVSFGGKLPQKLSRGAFLLLSDNIKKLRNLGLLEKEEDALSVLGYKYLEANNSKRITMGEVVSQSGSGVVNKGGGWSG